jgi:hypothetical protein
MGSNEKQNYEGNDIKQNKANLDIKVERVLIRKI